MATQEYESEADAFRKSIRLLRDGLRLLQAEAQKRGDKKGVLAVEAVLMMAKAHQSAAEAMGAAAKALAGITLAEPMIPPPPALKAEG